MKNIHVLPTDKPSRLHTYKGVLNLATGEFVAPTIVKNDLINLNIYITSDEEIKEGNYVVVSCSEVNIEEVRIVTGYYNEQFLFDDKSQIHMDYCKKIILTTDQNLIKDGVQSIDDEFLEWFINNPSCEFVEVENEMVASKLSSIERWDYEYKIIIPDLWGEVFNWLSQEEPKRETLEEAKQRILDSNYLSLNDADIFKMGAEWQRKQILDFLYSEITERRDYSASKMCEKVVEFIEQF